MKFFHLSDLHIGKQLHHYSLREDQEAVLGEIVAYAASIRPDAIVIAGDIYDRSVPSAEAVALFDWFLTRLSEITPAIPILIISGNHDSGERLEYAAEILRKHHIYLAGSAPRDAAERVRKVTLEDAYGEVDFYLLPFMKPSYVRNVFEEDAPETYTDAVGKILERESIDFGNRRNVLVSHQFYTGTIKGCVPGNSEGGVNAGKISEWESVSDSHGISDDSERTDGLREVVYPSICDSEMISVGGIENVDVSAVKDFDYVALGHLHGPQNIVGPHIRYCGTLLKYSVSESGHEKTLTVVTLKDKGDEPLIELMPLHPLRDVRKKTGRLKEIIEQAAEDERGDYISVTLTDEVDPYKPKEQLEKVFDHILEVRVDNMRTRTKLSELDEELVMKDPMENFADFYQEMQGRALNEEEYEMMCQIFEQVKEG